MDKHDERAGEACTPTSWKAGSCRGRTSLTAGASPLASLLYTSPPARLPRLRTRLHSTPHVHLLRKKKTPKNPQKPKKKPHQRSPSLNNIPPPLDSLRLPLSDGDALDPRRWTPRVNSSAPGLEYAGGQQQWYSPEECKVVGGALTLRTRRRREGGDFFLVPGAKRASASEYPFVSCWWGKKGERNRGTYRYRYHDHVF